MKKNKIFFRKIYFCRLFRSNPKIITEIQVKATDSESQTEFQEENQILTAIYFIINCKLKLFKTTKTYFLI